jgi:hypothetical protein
MKKAWASLSTGPVPPDLVASIKDASRLSFTIPSDGFSHSSFFIFPFFDDVVV